MHCNRNPLPGNEILSRQKLFTKYTMKNKTRSMYPRINCVFHKTNAANKLENYVIFFDHLFANFNPIPKVHFVGDKSANASKLIEI